MAKRLLRSVSPSLEDKDGAGHNLQVSREYRQRRSQWLRLLLGRPCRVTPADLLSALTAGSVRRTLRQYVLVCSSDSLRSLLLLAHSQMLMCC